MTTTDTTTALFYSTSTGQEPVVSAEAEADYTLGFGIEHESFCFVCGRVTDHFAEHDALVEAGMAEYAANGNVYKTDLYDEAEAKRIVDAEYEALYGELLPA